MDCQKFTKWINDFLYGTLDCKKTLLFAKHYEACRDCKEELEIAFLIERVLENHPENSYISTDDLDKHILIQVTAAQRYRRWSKMVGVIVVIAQMVALGHLLNFLIQYL